MHDASPTAAAWLERLAVRGLSPATIRCRRDALRALCAFLNGAGIGRWQDVTPATLDAWRRSMFAHTLSPATVQQRLTSVRLLFAHLEEHGLVFENPAARLRLHCAGRPLLRVPAPAQVRAVLAGVAGITPIELRDRALLELMYATGIRVDEVARLEPADIDLAADTVRVHGKGDRERLLPLGRAACAWLRRYLADARPELLERNPGGTGLWIGSTRGTRLGRQGISVRVRRHFRAAGFAARFSPHSLRRAAATHMLANGASPFAVRELLGHVSMKHLNRYLRVAIGDLRATHRRSAPGR